MTPNLQMEISAFAGSPPNSNVLDPRLAVLQSTDSTAVERNEALTSIMQEFSPQLHHRVTKITGDPETANDVVQDAFLKAYEKMPEYRPTGSVGGWLMRIAYNQALDELKRADRRYIDRTYNHYHTDLEQTAAYRENESYFGQDPATIIEEKDERQQASMVLHRVLMHATSAQRQAITLQLQGLTYEEIAAKLGISYPSAKARIYRARQVIGAELLKTRDLEVA